MNYEHLFKRMCVIRAFEELLLESFRDGKIHGTTHTCIGQEANAVGVIGAIDTLIDSVWSNHRCHGHFIEYSNRVDLLLYEILGSEKGVCGGYGGSQHLHFNNFFSSGVQGAFVPVACGYQLEKSKTDGSIGVIFIGDGTLGQGILYETLNMVALFKIPVIFVVENNGISQTTAHTDNFSGSVVARFKSFNIDGIELETTDMKEIHDAALSLVLDSRKTQSPKFLHIKTIRLEAHSKGDDTRSQKLLKEIRKLDPLIVNAKYVKYPEKLMMEAREEMTELFGRCLDATY